MKTAVFSVCSKKPLNCKIKTSPENGQPHPFHPTQLLFWTLPEQLSMLHHACVPTHPEDTPQNLRPQDFHLTHPSFELCRSCSPYYTTHVCQPWTNVPKIHHKTSDPKIFISHIPVLNFAGTALHVTPCMWANPSWTNVPRHTTNFNPKMFISHIPVSNFGLQGSVKSVVEWCIMSHTKACLCSCRCFHLHTGLLLHLSKFWKNWSHACSTNHMKAE